MDGGCDRFGAALLSAPVHPVLDHVVRLAAQRREAMRLIYASKKGGKPMRLGMNYAKRVARSADQRDQLAVLRELGPGLPRQHSHHQQLVRQRHQYYGDAYNEFQEQRARAPQPSDTGADPQESGDADRAVPEPEAGTDHQQRDDGV